MDALVLHPLISEFLHPKQSTAIALHGVCKHDYCRAYGDLYVRISDAGQLEYYMGRVNDVGIFSTITQSLQYHQKAYDLVRLSGRMPSEECEWSLDIRVCEHGHLKFDALRVYDSWFYRSDKDRVHVKTSHCQHH